MRSTKRRSRPKRASVLLGALIAGAFLLVPGLARAAETLDQSQEQFDGSGRFVYVHSSIGQIAAGQTFTASISGPLTRVELNLSTQGGLDPIPPDAPLMVTIESVSNGLPTGTVLASATVEPSAISDTDAWISVEFSNPPTVSAGTSYAILATSDSTEPWLWNGVSADVYSAGDLLGWSETPIWEPDPGHDLTFRTYVDGIRAGAAAQFLAPLDQSTNEGTVLNIAKNGRVVPVRVQLAQDGSPITDMNASGPVTIKVTDLGLCGTQTSSDPVEVYSAGSSSTGLAFRYDAAAEAWVYNLDTKAMGLASGNCYRIAVVVDGSEATNAWAILKPVQ